MDSRPSKNLPRRLMWFILALHGLLLLLSLPDYRVSIDSGYHVSLGRYYAEHGTAFWDHINYGPGGRPNLQGPLLHYGIAVLGWLMGGSGDAYVLANAILAFLQWVAAMFTAVYFARRYGGDWAALFAAALLSGSAFAAGSFFVGLPSGWTFILTPWAIHFFLRDRLSLSALFATGAIYVHLSGYATAPFGIFVAAVLARRWRNLAIVGVVTALLTAPYTIHFLRHLAWYRGQHGHVATWATPLIYLLAAAGLARLLRRPRENVFLLAWFAAPLAWVIQDYTRFLMQSNLAGSVLGGLFLAWLFERRFSGWRRPVFASLLVAVATVFPLGLPSLALEATWALGLRFPRFLDWSDARTIAGVIERAGLADRLVSVYAPSYGPALAVYAPIKLERGHWVEVQPRPDPVDRLSAAEKVYVVPVPPEDPVLLDLAKRGLVEVHGGSGLESVITLPARGRLESVAPLAAEIASREASWLSAHAVNNRLPPPGEILSKAALEERRRRMLEQRTRMGRIEVVALIYAYSLEPVAPERARGSRGSVRGFGEMARFLGDDSAIDFVSDARHARLRQNLARYAQALRSLRDHPLGTPELDAASDRLFGEYFWAA